MSAQQLSAKIETLVDHLRGHPDDSLSLADVASVTEVLIGAMNSFFKGIDTKIYRECRAMSDYISNAKHEIAALQPDDLESSHIPRAGLELDAIVQHTEEATNTIMESAEAIMAADPSDVEGFQKTVQDNIVQIFEACSFQDITGQRISKVVQTLSHIEERILQLKALLGVSKAEAAQTQPAQEPAQEAAQGDAALLRGPSLEGEGIDQDEVDALFAGEPAAAPAPAPTPAPAAAEKPKAKAKAKIKAVEAPAADAAPASSEAGHSRQDEIDALFG